jgi:hypothetical protein
MIIAPLPQKNPNKQTNKQKTNKNKKQKIKPTTQQTKEIEFINGLINSP